MSAIPKRKRNPNWHKSEKMLLLSIVEDNIKIFENKKTDGATMREKNKAWEDASQKYNSNTSLTHRTAANLKAEWELLKKAAKKYVANKRIAAIMTGDGLPKPDSYDDPLYAKILSLIQHSAVNYYNHFDLATVQPLEVVDESNSPPEKQSNFNSGSECSDSETLEVEDQKPSASYQQEAGSDCPTYTPMMLWTPLSAALAADSDVEEECSMSEKAGTNHQSPTLQNSALERLHEQKIAALQLQMRLADEERSEGRAAHELHMKQKLAAHKLDMELKTEQLKQEKLRTELLLIKINKES